ncbi:Beta-glucuronidase [Eumeta japonica]|uniref:Beta-glucuronidase n=1 Tax=Eumeta variegata TaxID=151549 RepID=A0A4C1V1T6_EUMVA|nr:Beta-glucuronidase [Eumeta japonica]
MSQAIVQNSPNDNDINRLKKKMKISTSTALYPQASETRDIKTLDGIWNFRMSPTDPEYGYQHGWFEQDLEKTGPVQPMPVPSSFNDIGQTAALRDHVGLVWYDRRFRVPQWWVKTEQRIWLRFSSVHYAAQVDYAPITVDNAPIEYVHEYIYLEFKRGRINLSDEFRDGRPSTAVNNKNIDAVRRMIETDRRVTYHEIQAFLGIGMSQTIDPT